MTEQKKEFSTILSTANNTYLPLIQRQLEGNDIVFNDYAKKCVLNAISSINQMLSTAGVNWNDASLDQSNLTQVLLNVASLELNATAVPRECYFQIRNVKKKVDGKDVWKKQIEFNIEGFGNDALLARFGRDVEKVYPCWLVREDDDFKYPQYKGVEYVAPEWTPKGTGKVVRVVYPILHKDKTLHYYIGERADVANNLLAHINNNLMNETFGICADRFKATAEQSKEIAKKKAEIKAKAKELGLKAISDPELSQYISPAWKEDFSSESMIIRKMQNNVVKKIPKDFGNALSQESYYVGTDEGYKDAKRNIVESNATVEVLDMKALEGGDFVQNEPLTDKTPVSGTSEPTVNKNPSAGNFEPDASVVDPANRTKPNFD